MNNPEVSSRGLKAMALELGASLELPGGKVFNSAGNKGSLPTAKPKPTEDKTQQLLEKLVEMASKPAPAAAPTPAPVVDVKVEAPKPTSWSFSFVRNQDGTIKDIVAKPMT